MKLIPWRKRIRSGAAGTLGVFVAFSGVVVGCSFQGNAADGDERPEPTGTLESSLSGLVWQNGPVRETRVVVRDSAGDIIQGNTDAEGRFTFDLGPVSGQIEVVSGGLRQRVSVAQVGDTVESVLLSPIGTLAEAYVDSNAPGTREAKLSTVSAFFQTPLTGASLVTFDTRLGESCDDFEDASLGPSALGGLMQSGLRFLGEAMIAESGLSGRPDDILAALVQDLAADGFLDGIGPDGETLSFAGIELDALVLRPRYINAMTAFLRSSRNQSGFDAACFKRFFDEILLSRSALFPASSWINTSFRTGCAACTQLPSGEFACTTDDCGPCGTCSVDFAGPQPTAMCEPAEALCTGTCDRCAPMPDDATRFSCAPEPTLCGGRCASCGDNGEGGFSCRADVDQCEGTCAACVRDVTDQTVYECAANELACTGGCGTCAAEGDAFNCEGNVALCPAPTDGTARCNACIEGAPNEFRCQDRRTLCPADTETVVSECRNEVNVCAQSGTEDVRRVSWVCELGQCLDTETNAQQSCVRITNGDDCGALACTAPFSVCTQASGGDACTNEGVRTRECAQPTCFNGACTNTRTVVQEQGCVFDPVGEQCGARDCPSGRVSQQFLCCSAPFQCDDVCSQCDD